jgi:hypothetical protein
MKIFIGASGSWYPEMPIDQGKAHVPIPKGICAPLYSVSWLVRVMLIIVNQVSIEFYQFEKVIYDERAFL